MPHLERSANGSRVYSSPIGWRLSSLNILQLKWQTLLTMGRFDTDQRTIGARTYSVGILVDQGRIDIRY